MSYDRSDDIAVPVTSLYPPQSEGTEHDELEEEREDTPEPPPPPTAKTVSRRRRDHTGRQQSSTSQHPHLATQFDKDPDIAVPQIDDLNPPHRSSQTVRNLNGTSSDIHAMTQPLVQRNGNFNGEINNGQLNRTTSHTSSSSSSQPTRVPDFVTASTSSLLHQQQGRPPLGPPAVGSQRIGSNLSHEGSSNNMNNNHSSSNTFLNQNNSAQATLSPSGKVRSAMSTIYNSASHLLGGGQRSNGSESQSGHPPQTHLSQNQRNNGQSHTAHPSPSIEPYTTAPAAPTSSASPRTNEEIEATLVIRKTQAMNRLATTATARTKFSDIANAESQIPDVVDTDEEDEHEQLLIHGASQGTSQAIRSAVTQAEIRASQQPLRSSQLSHLAGSQSRSSIAAAGRPVSSLIPAYTRSSSQLPLPDRRPTNRTITSPPKAKNGLFQKPPSRNDDEETEQSDEDEDEDDDHLDLDGRRDSSDPDRTRVNGSYRTGDSDTSAQTHKDAALFKKNTSQLPSKNQKNQQVYNGRTSNNGNGNGKKAPMAKRTGGAPAGPKASQKIRPQVTHEIIDDDDEESDDGRPPPLSEKRTKTANEPPHGELRTSSRTKLNSAEHKRTTPALAPPSKSKSLREPTPGTRRSGRSSNAGAVVSSLKVGDRIPWGETRDFLEKARNTLGHGQHVANLTLGSMYLNKENKFEETQLAEADNEPRVRTWQFFVYCRNRKLPSTKPPKSPRTRDAHSTTLSREGSHASPSRTSNGNGGAPTASGSSSGSGVSTENADTPSIPVPSFQMPPEGIYRHAKDANCPAQISAYLVPDVRTFETSYWVVDQVAEHCLECMGLDMEIGKGMTPQLQARDQYFEYWAQHWDKQVYEVLTSTHTFRKRPLQNNRGAVDQQLNRSNEQSRPAYFDGHFDDSGGAGDDEDESLEVQPARTMPNRKAAKRKASEILEEELFDGVDEVRPPSPELEEVLPSPPKKARQAARGKSQTVQSPPRSRAKSKPSPAKRKSSMKQPNQGTGGAKANNGKSVRVQEESDLHPGTAISDLQIDKSIEHLLEECEIFTLENLRNATKGDNTYFEAGTDIPIEDFLSFMQARLLQHARGNNGMQYDWNTPQGRLNERDVDAGLEEDAKKTRFLQDGITILRASRVLVRALRAVKW